MEGLVEGVVLAVAGGLLLFLSFLSCASAPPVFAPCCVRVG